MLLHTQLSIVLALSAASAVLAQAPAPAEESPPADAPASPSARAAAGLTIQLTPRAEHTFESDLQDNAAQSSITRAGGELRLRYPAGERFSLGLTLDGEYSWYDISGIDTAGNDLGGLLDGAYSLGLTPSVLYSIDRKWGVLVGGLVQSEAEEEAEFSDSLTYGAFGAVRYAVNDNFAVTFGGGIRTRLEDNAIFLPVIGFEWNASTKVKLATERLGLKVTVKINDEVSAWLSGNYELREYRLTDEHFLAPEGVGRDHRVPIRFGINWTPSPAFTLEGYTGVVVWQEYEFLDADGNEAFDDHSDPTGVIGVKATFTF